MFKIGLGYEAKIFPTAQMFKSIKTAPERWKSRLRITLALRDPAAEFARATAQELDRLVDLQMAYWAPRASLSGNAAQESLHEINNRSLSVFIYSVRHNSVRIWPKPFSAEDAQLRHRQLNAFSRRSRLYQTFFQALVRRSVHKHSIDFAVDVNDIPESSTEFPIFGFQKLRGAANLLLPDVDFFHNNWYRHDQDALKYEQKSLSACFVGSSTGAKHTVDSIRQHESPRLRAAAQFQGNSRVYFRIANAVQCQSAEAKSCLMQQPYYTQHVEWEDQLRHRFIISLDGNGAACSRLVKGLRSNSVVIKFDSAYELYYFPALRPGVDYIGVADANGIEPILDRELSNPGNFRAVAESGRQFAGKYLNIHSVMDYSERLINSFAAHQRI